ncbi:DAK2 domain-containing protein [Oerskovia gallyi]|uniref:DAK2 domain-containing protein n=1 Tax=Oerskovia gallyi TaxID=2762226 RepID=A0ABR8UY95_9CELL|nr:DAK2 domain-containing protein [Oerskovia gallyi]MBD7997522.1 DAK2 domain-containing protein [Oerskovia gallyi]
MTDGTEHIEPAVVRTWVAETVRALGEARARIDRANVFPVADADTGTNLFLTVTEGARAVGEVPDGAPVDTVLLAFARGALIGARGNSGVILSEYLRGFAGATTVADEPVGSLRVATRLEAAARSSYAAVAVPVPGTILTAADGAAVAARAAAEAGADLSGVVRAARAGAHEAMLRSPRELDVLSRAGVLDAGAFGLVLVLDALCHALGAVDDGPGLGLGTRGALSVADGTMARMTSGTTGVDDVTDVTSVPAPGTALVGRTTAQASGVVVPVAGAAPGEHAPVGIDGEFEVMLVVDGTDGTDGTDAPAPATPPLADALRAALAQVGDSVVVVGEGVWQAHVHTDDPARAVQAARAAAGGARGARLRQVCVRHLATQVAARGSLHGHALPTSGEVPEHGVVAITSAPGLVPDLARSGAVVLLATDHAPTPGEVLRVAVDTGARTVAVLPGSAGAADAAREAEGLVGQGAGDLRGIEVLDAPTDLHVVAALAAATLGSAAADAVALMKATLEEVRAVQVPADGTLVRPALEGLLRTDDEVLTVLPGRWVDPVVVDVVAGIARQCVPGIEVVVLDSGRDHADLELGAE